MISPTYSTADQAYISEISNLLESGSKTSPRGRPTREIIGSTVVIEDPAFSVITLPKRRLNYSFMAAEFLWMMSGMNRVDMIEPFNKNIVMAQNDGEVTFTGAYGPKIVEQLGYVVSTLRRDPDSRQAIIGIWRERPRESRDIPCTVSLQFLIRDGKLRMITYMRSNDVWLGFPYDVFNFTMLQRYTAYLLGVEAGEYIHMAGSFHLYDDNEEAARSVAEDTTAYIPLYIEPFESDQMGRVSALFADLATTGSREPGYLLKWWDRAGRLDNPWRDLLAVAAHRFEKSIEPSGKWERVMYRHRHLR